MVTIVVVVFIAVFVLVLLIGYMSIQGSAEMTQMSARLAAIAGPATPQEIEELIDIRREDSLTGISWLNRALHFFNLFPILRKLLRQANVTWTLGNLMLISGALLVVGAALVYLRTEAWPVALLAGLVLASAPWIALLQKRAKRFSEFEEKLPEALDMIVSAIRAGHGFTSALGLATKEIGDPIASEFRTCFDEQNFGVDLRVAMNNLVDRVPIADMRFIAASVLIQKESGGNLAEILEKAAYIIRERFRLKRQIRVHTAQGRLTGWILSVTPVVFGVMFYIQSPERMSILWHRPIGIKLLWGAAIMDVIGALIIKKIISIKV